MTRPSVLVLLTLLAPGVVWADLGFTPSDADAVLTDHRTGGITSFVSVAAGDFNLDGRADVAVHHLTATARVVDVLAGGRWRGADTLDAKRVFRVILPPLGGNAIRGVVAPAFVDINGDGRADLILRSMGSPAKVWVFFGRPTPGIQVDLNSQSADLEIAVPDAALGFASGDVDGDGIPDMVLGVPWAYGSRGVCYLIRGRPSFPGVVTAGDPFWGPTFLGDATQTGALGYSAAMGDVDGDGRADLFLSAYNMDLNGNLRGMTYGFFGSSSTTWNDWDLTTATAPLSFPPSTWCYNANVAGAGDFDGDGKDDLVFYTYNQAKMVWVSGTALGPGALTLSPDPPFQPLDYFIFPDAGDFDGDGRQDLFAKSGSAPFAGRAWLTSDPGSPGTLAAPNATFSDGTSAAALGDVDGDGKADALRVGEFYSGSRTDLRLTVVYGFHPFWSPSFTVRARTDGVPRAVLDFAPGGSASQLRISGAVADPAGDRWIPYQSSLEIMLTPEEGGKTITVTYQEPGGRESSPVSRSLVLAPVPDGVVARANRVRPGEDGVWDISTPGGTFRVAIYDAAGGRVREVDAGDRPAGVYTVRWDGRNEAGRFVAPGVYILSVESGGTRHRVRTLVAR